MKREGKKPVRLVIFDLDGTLFNTSYTMMECGNYALRKLGLPEVDLEHYKAASGGGVQEYTNEVLDAAGDTEHRFTDAFWGWYQERQESLCSEEANRPYPGIPGLLDALQQRGIQLAALSNKDEETMDSILNNILGEGVFAMALGYVPHRPAKPDPAGAREIMETLGVLPEETLYLGDTEIDLETARRAGIPSVGVLWGYRKREKLEKSSPDYLIARPEEVLDLL